MHNFYVHEIIGLDVHVHLSTLDFFHIDACLVSGEFVKDNLPQVIRQINLLGQKRDSVEALRESVFANLSRLREQIELARDAANRVRIFSAGLQFIQIVISLVL